MSSIEAFFATELVLTHFHSTLKMSFMNEQEAFVPHDTKSVVAWSAPATIAWGLGILTFFIFLQLLATMFYVGHVYGDISQEEFASIAGEIQYNGTLLSLSLTLTGLVCTALVVMIIGMKAGTSLNDYLLLKSVTWVEWRRWFGILGIFLAVSTLLSVVTGQDTPIFVSEVYSTADPFWMLLLAIIIAAPLFDEVFFRGFLHRGLAQSLLGHVGAIVITAVLWAAIHTQYDYWDMTVVFLLGLLLGAARTYGGSLYLPLALHAAHNGISVILFHVSG